MNSKSGFGIPLAIIGAGILIAIAVIFSGSSNSSGQVVVKNGGHGNGDPSVMDASFDFRLINDSDHIRGNLGALVTVVEFSDFECPFCARLHPTLQRLVKENDDVNWAYRHFPLTSIHSRALSASIASECIANLGGSDAFWTFTDKVFENQRNLRNEFYEEIATSLNIDQSKFNSCLNDKNVSLEVDKDLEEALANGGRGTPFAIIITKDKKLIPFSGALPYEQILSLIEQARVN